jgi:hypothetical protein
VIFQQHTARQRAILPHRDEAWLNVFPGAKIRCNCTIILQFMGVKPCIRPSIDLQLRPETPLPEPKRFKQNDAAPEPVPETPED